ncbi:hypothetical protein B9J77_02485 [candidate division NPL-UPA2 bacterium Unc8]|uniref:Uncharacterized protein n=1 Tax=candidate division NPL-UPA2 bacterium Unc8 TaxID=1980939 RepID=A0A399FWR2_UNCN2|nr:MAG: hypothetical protein B9J77_02485 [candidate division NPL-UPA2 bacterium Unc8]
MSQELKSREVLQKCVDMEQEEHVKWSEKAMMYGLGVAKDDGVVEQNRQLFHYTVNMMKSRGQEETNV